MRLVPRFLLNVLLGLFLLVTAANPAAAQTGPNPRVRLETTLGAIVLVLDRGKAPLTVENFLRYVREGFYEGLIFHRVIPSFMIQGGGFDAEMNRKVQGMHPPVPLEAKNGLKNLKGTVAMARTSDPDSATSQFFINVVDNPMLDHPRPDGHGYTVFGRVDSGMEVVEAIRNAEVIRHPKYPSRNPVTPATPVVILKAQLEK